MAFMFTLVVCLWAVDVWSKVRCKFLFCKLDLLYGFT